MEGELGMGLGSARGRRQPAALLHGTGGCDAQPETAVPLQHRLRAGGGFLSCFGLWAWAQARVNLIEGLG